MNNGLSGFIWSIADRLRGDYKRSDYGKVILPFTVLRRLDCVLEPTKGDVLDALPRVQDKNELFTDHILQNASGQPFYNRSQFTFASLADDPNQTAANLKHYINGFSANVREIMEYFSFAVQIDRLDKADLLYQIIEAFQAVDLHPEVVSNHQMGTVFEELIRKFAESSNETAGEHFTPREVIKLMVNLLFIEDRDVLRREGIVRTLYDPACGTGGMLSIAEEYLYKLNEGARLILFGQEVNPESYAICKADMLIKGQDASNIKFGNSFTADGLPNKQFNYMLSNPPFGVNWSKVAKHVKAEHNHQEHEGRFGAGVPRISDGSFLFLQHMLSKRKDSEEGTRIAVVFNGSPLFAGGAGTGESEIRRWLIENDWLEAIIALPEQLFYNTGIATYIWVLTNRKRQERKGKIQLIEATDRWVLMPKSLGDKRRRIGDPDEGDPDHIAEITRAYGDFQRIERGPNEKGVRCKIFDNTDFGYRRIRIERPLRCHFQRSKSGLERLRGLTQLPEGLIERAIERLGRDLTEDQPVFTDRGAFAEAMQAIWSETEGDLPTDRQFHDILMEFAMRDEETGEIIRHETAEIVHDHNGKKVADTDLRDYENVPLKFDVKEYFAREVKPYVPDAWINTKYRDKQDHGIGRVGYGIPFGRHFYVYKPPPKLEILEQRITALEEEIQGRLAKVIS